MARRPSNDVVYEALAARRLQWDNLIWQVPALNLTGQAFLFTIVLAPDSTTLARCVSSALAFVLSTASVLLIAKHRQAEITDAHWLRDLEGDLPPSYRIHGPGWAKRRNMNRLGVPALDWFPLPRGFITWAVVLSLFAAASAALFVISLIWPEALSGADH